MRSKIRNLVLTTGALAALAVGAAAFAQAQNAGNAAQVAVQQSIGGDQGGPGDTDGVKRGDQGARDAPAHENEAD